MNIARVIHAIVELLEREESLSEEVMSIADSVLIDVWFVEDPEFRKEIIQNAAVLCGLLRADEID